MTVLWEKQLWEVIDFAQLPPYLPCSLKRGEPGCDARPDRLGRTWSDRTPHGRYCRYHLEPAAPTSPRKGESARFRFAAEAGLDPRTRPQYPRLCRHPQHRARQRPAYGM